MSFKLMVRVWEEADLTRPQQAILLAMADHADDDGGSCFPSVNRIAWKTGYKPRNVIDIMRGLRQMGVLVLVAEASQHRATEYRINIDKAPRKKPLGEWIKDHGRHARPEVQSDEGDSQRCNTTSSEVQSDVDGEREIAPRTISSNHQDESSGVAVASQQQRTPRRKASRPTDGGQSKSPRAMPRNGMAQTLVAVLYEDVLKTGSPTAYQKAVGQAQKLAKAGLVPDDVAKLVGWIREDSFRSKNGIDMGTLLAWHDKWRATLAPSTAHRQPQQTEADPYWGQMLAGLEGEE